MESDELRESFGYADTLAEARQLCIGKVYAEIWHTWAGSVDLIEVYG